MRTGRYVRNGFYHADKRVVGVGAGTGRDPQPVVVGPLPEDPLEISGVVQQVPGHIQEQPSAVCGGDTGLFAGKDCDPIFGLHLLEDPA